MDKSPPAVPETKMSTAITEATIKRNTCGEVGHKTVRYSGQVCGACGGKGHSTEICANVVTVLVCEEDTRASDGNLLSREEDIFDSDVLDKSFDESNEGNCSALALQMRDLGNLRQ